MSYRWFAMARALHVLGIVIWIGGIGAVTTVMFPLMRQLDSDEQKIWMFQQIEKRFRPQARLAWAVVGLSGLYMVGALDAWSRFANAHFWWMDAMVALWIIFGLMLFIVEPFVVGPRLEQTLKDDPVGALRRMQVMHWLLLILSLLVIAVVIGGIYGWL